MTNTSNTKFIDRAGKAIGTAAHAVALAGAGIRIMPVRSAHS